MASCGGSHPLGMPLSSEETSMGVPTFCRDIGDGGGGEEAVGTHGRERGCGGGEGQTQHRRSADYMWLLSLAVRAERSGL
jgi:hypothetical protein